MFFENTNSFQKMFSNDLSNGQNMSLTERIFQVPNTGL